MRYDGQTSDEADSVIEEFEQVWRAQSDGKSIPSAQSIDPGEIARLMPHLMLLEVVSGGIRPHFRTRLVGAEHREAAGVLHAGDILDEIDREHAERAREAAATGRPVYWRAEKAAGAAACEFPFASDGENVDRVISVIVCNVKKGGFFRA